MRSFALIFAMASVGACGGVAAIDVHDERVPLEARQWVGGADDGVAIAESGVDDARVVLREVEVWKRGLAANKARRGATLEAPLTAFVAAREKLAELRLADAEAMLTLAQRTRTLVHAETAMRYDLAVYDLPLLRAAVEAARSGHERLSRAAEEAVVAREAASATFWSAYRSAYAQNPEIGAMFWGGK